MDRLISFPSIVQGIRNAQAEVEEAKRKAIEDSKIDLSSMSIFAFSGMNAENIARKKREIL